MKADESHRPVQSGLPGASRRAVLRAAAAWALLESAWAVAAPAEAPPPLAGRWEGQAELPGMSVALVLDLRLAGAGWSGQATLPGRGLSGVPLRGLVLTGSRLEARLGGPATGQDAATAGIELAPGTEPGTLQGHFVQAGHRAPLTMVRTGEAHWQPAALPAPLDPRLAGTWRGRYDIGFGERQVTLRLLPPSSAAMTVVGRRTTELEFDEAGRFGQLWILRSAAFGITVEAPVLPDSPDELRATLRQGPFESPLQLLREASR